MQTSAPSVDILTRNLIWIFYSSGYESELKEILYDEAAVTSPDDVEVSVEDIEDEEKLEQLGKAILHFNTKSCKVVIRSSSRKREKELGNFKLKKTLLQRIVASCKFRHVRE